MSGYLQDTWVDDISKRSIIHHGSDDDMTCSLADDLAYLQDNRYSLNCRNMPKINAFCFIQLEYAIIFKYQQQSMTQKYTIW